MAAIILTRCSTDEQSDSRNGLNAQQDACEAWAKAHGEVIAATYSDEGISGAASLEKRLGLMSAINALSASDILLVAKRDRLGRDPLILAMIESSVTRVGARIVSAAGEGTENDEPSQVLMRRLVDAFSEYERLLIKTRTKAALAAKKARGQRVGSVPYGHSLGPNGKDLVINPAEQEVIREARALRAAGTTLAAIALILAAKGLKARNGKTFQATQVMRLAA